MQVSSSAYYLRQSEEPLVTLWLAALVCKKRRAGRETLAVGILDRRESKFPLAWRSSNTFSATAVYLVTLYLLACSLYTGEIGRGIS